MTQLIERDDFRLKLIRDSLLGSRCRYSEPSAFFLQFLNHVLLLFQKPIIIGFWQDGALAYSTLRDPDFSGRGMDWEYTEKWSLPFADEQYRMTLHEFGNLEYQNVGGKSILRIDRKATRLARLLLSGDGPYRLPADFVEFLGQGAISLIDQVRANEKRQKTDRLATALDIDYDRVKEQLRPMRLALDDIFGEVIRSKSRVIQKNGLSYPNIFAVVRTRPWSASRYKRLFNYTAGLLLFTETQNALLKWCSTNRPLSGKKDPGRCERQQRDPMDCIVALEQPLGKNSRSVADLIFSSGTIAFGREAGESGLDISGAGDLLDERRRFVEKCIYPENGCLFYLPVHVGGTPWLSLFTFTPKDPVPNPESWHHNYSFYRDLVEPASALIRERAQEAYELLVAKTIVKHMEYRLTVKDALVTRTNVSLQELAQTYPFPMVTIGPPKTPNRKFYAAGRGEYGMSFIQNPYFPRLVNWMIGNEEAIYLKCRGELDDFTQMERSIEVNATAQTSHMLKVPLLTLEGILAATTPDRDRLLERQLKKILNRHDFAAALLNEDKRQEFLQFNLTVRDLEKTIQLKYEDLSKDLLEPCVSGNIAPRLRSLRESGGIAFVSCYPPEARDIRMSFFDQMVETILEGFLTNAIDNVDYEKPVITVRFLAFDINGRYRAYLEVANRVSLEDAQLDLRLQRLNSPGPDLVGVSELHWASKACWPDLQKAERLIWEKKTTRDGFVLMSARALIGRDTR